MVCLHHPKPLFTYPNAYIQLANKHQADAGLPAGWEVRHSQSKNLPYYFNESQKQSRWEPPQGTDTEKLKTYMAEHHSAAEIRPDSGMNGNGDKSGKIRVSHLLIKHRDSRRPSSWREVRLCLILGISHIQASANHQ
jgi:NIMA-interacting peptidyl-prolyl cis-trans isomerase 1